MRPDSQIHEDLVDKCLYVFYSIYENTKQLVHNRSLYMLQEFQTQIVNHVKTDFSFFSQSLQELQIQPYMFAQTCRAAARSYYTQPHLFFDDDAVVSQTDIIKNKNIIRQIAEAVATENLCENTQVVDDDGDVNMFDPESGQEQESDEEDQDEEDQNEEQESDKEEEDQDEEQEQESDKDEEDQDEEHEQESDKEEQEQESDEEEAKTADSESDDDGMIDDIDDIDLVTLDITMRELDMETPSNVLINEILNACL